MQHIGVQGRQEAIVGAAAAVMEVLLRPKDSCRHLFGSSACIEEGYRSIEPKGIGLPAQVSLVEALHQDGSVLGAVLDAQCHVRTTDALVQQADEEGSSAWVGFA